MTRGERARKESLEPALVPAEPKSRFPGQSDANSHEPYRKKSSQHGMVPTAIDTQGYVRMSEIPADFYTRFRWHARYRTPWRLAMWLRKQGVPVFPSLLGRLVRILYGLELPPWNREPDGLVLMHNGMGTVIHPGTHIEDGPAIIFQGVTIGNSWNPSVDGEPTLIPPLIVGAGAVIVGPITVGPNVIIGANAVVATDVGSGTLVRPGACDVSQLSADVRQIILHDSRIAGKDFAGAPCVVRRLD